MSRKKTSINRKGTAVKRGTIVQTNQDFQAFFDPDLDAENPLADVDYNQPLQDAVDEEAAKLKAALKESDKKIADAMRLSLDTEYWTCLVFQSRKQKEAFLMAMNWLDKYGDKYLDGVAIASELGVNLELEDMPKASSANRSRLTKYIQRR